MATLNPTLPPSAAGLSGRDLSCHRGGRIVFSGLSFELAPGDALVLTGANGSGKSTLLRAMAGLLPLHSGHFAWAGGAILDDPGVHRRRVGFVGHQDACKPVLSVAEDVEFWAAMTARRGAGERSKAALDRMGLSRLADLPARFLSAGQRRRLALARLAVKAAPLWLLDEPTVALDEDGLDRLGSLMDEHRRSGGLIVAATHTALGLADAQVITMNAFAPAASGNLA